MFGYIKVFKPELKIREFDVYQGVYCGVCKALGRNFGQAARLTLNYDITFLCLLRLSLSDEELYLQKKRCGFNPFKRRPCCMPQGADFHFAVSVAMIMNYYKLLDNLTDEKFFKRAVLKMSQPYFYFKYKKAKKSLPEIDEICKEMLRDQAFIEKSREFDIDSASHPTANALGRIFSFGRQDEAAGRALYQMGYCIGKWVYLIDAVDDFEKDLKENRFNPLFAFEKAKESGLTPLKQEIEPLLTNCISEAVLAFELIGFKRYKEVLANILYLGLDFTQGEVFNKQQKHCKS